MQIDVEQVAEHIREVAAERIEPRFQTLGDHEIDAKTGPTDLVTIADIEAEEDLTRILQDLLPGSHVVGEEAVSKEQTDMGLLKEEDDPVWVVDPVDGTNNFAAGNPVFGSMVSLVYGGQTVQSWIYDIPGRRMGMAEQGAGARINENPLQLSPKGDVDLSKTKGFVSTKFVPKDLRAAVEEKLGLFEQTGAYFCCAHEYLALASGERDFSFYSRIKPWDHLAGALIYAESGGYSRKWDKSFYVPSDQKGGLINAANEPLWHELQRIFLDIKN